MVFGDSVWLNCAARALAREVSSFNPPTKRALDTHKFEAVFRWRVGNFTNKKKKRLDTRKELPLSCTVDVTLDSNSLFWKRRKKTVFRDCTESSFIEEKKNILYNVSRHLFSRSHFSSFPVPLPVGSCSLAAQLTHSLRVLHALEHGFISHSHVCSFNEAQSCFWFTARCFHSSLGNYDYARWTERESADECERSS